jgi:hypothetical protein
MYNCPQRFFFAYDTMEKFVNVQQQNQVGNGTRKTKGKLAFAVKEKSMNFTRFQLHSVSIIKKQFQTISV